MLCVSLVLLIFRYSALILLKMPYSAGRMLTPKIAYSAQNSAGRIYSSLLGISVLLYYIYVKVRMMFYSVMAQAYSEKEIPSSPSRSRTYDLPITSSDALPLSYRRLVGA